VLIAVLKVPGFRRLKLRCDDLHSRFAFNVNVCRYNKDSFRSRRAPVYVDVRPRPRLVMPTDRQTRLLSNRTR